MRSLIVGAIALLFSANLAWADIVATWILSDGAVTKLSIRDAQHVRIDLEIDSVDYIGQPVPSAGIPKTAGFSFDNSTGAKVQMDAQLPD